MTKYLLIAVVVVGLLGASGTLWYRSQWLAQVAAVATQAAKHNEAVAELRRADKTAELAAVNAVHGAAMARNLALERQLARIRDAQRTGRDAPAAPVLVEAVE